MGALAVFERLFAVLDAGGLYAKLYNEQASQHLTRL
jgi:hypothetical protein